MLFGVNLWKKFLQLNKRWILNNPGKVSHKMVDAFALS